ncbi:MAG: hypothetical protein PHT07_15280 [Paludibacter sp.]|nr:hypothetical protein [Paludibacter sp.]
MKTIIPNEYWTGIGLLENECPWLVPEAIRRLEEIDMSNMTVLEFGAGGSTLFFARRAKNVISIENEIIWYEKITHALFDKNIKNVKMHWWSMATETAKIDKHYDLILIDNAGDRKPVMDLVSKLDLTGTIVIIDNYADYHIISTGGRVEFFDDEHWNGKGTMIIYN